MTRPLLIFLLIFVGCGDSGVKMTSLVNFAHLRHLTERIQFGNDSAAIVHIYSQYPDYQWVDAKESGPEGIACVDDAARAAVVYLRHYEKTRERTSLNEAKLLLRFILALQVDDGQFYNFIFADHSINRDGKTSYKAIGWWGARALWALSHGYKVLKQVDAPFALSLKAAVEKTFVHLDEMISQYGSFDRVRGYRVPRWLIYQYGEYTAAATSELMLGLCEYYEANPDDRVAKYIEQFAEGLLAMQAGDFQTAPHGAFFSEPGMWHDWANGQTQALATAGKLLQRKTWVEAAEREARWFYTRLLIEGHFREWDITNSSMKVFPQIAYGLRPMVVGSLRLSEATGKKEYEIIAGLFASWFLGNNVTGRAMYDPKTGRCYDGIQDSVITNLNSGAESTIEALYSLLEVESFPAARELLTAKLVKRVRATDPYALFRTKEGKEITVKLNSALNDAVITIQESNVGD